MEIQELSGRLKNDDQGEKTDYKKQPSLLNPFKSKLATIWSEESFASIKQHNIITPVRAEYFFELLYIAKISRVIADPNPYLSTIS